MELGAGMNQVVDHHPRHVVKLRELDDAGAVYECVTCGRIDAREQLQGRCPKRAVEEDLRKAS